MSLKMKDKTIRTKILRDGFTLIELLVVMGVISILAGMSIFALQGARESARDASRMGDLEAIATALEFYKADCHEYPPNGTVPGSGTWSSNCSGSNVTYMENVPQDPLGVDYSYLRLSLTRYALCSTLEDPPDPANDTTGCGGCNGGDCEYRVTNP